MSFLAANRTLRRIVFARSAALLFLTGLCVFLTPRAAAQKQPSGPPGGSPSNPGQPSGAIGTGVRTTLDMNAAGSVLVRVLGPHDTPLKEQSFVRLYTATGELLKGGLTNLEGSLSFNNLPGFGWYAVEVSAAGYHTQRKQFDYSDNHSYFEVDVTMQPDSDDSVSHYVAFDRLPSGAQKHIDKGLTAFGSGDFKRAEKELTAAYNAAPANSETNYVLGVFYFRAKNVPLGEKYLTTAVSIDSGNIPALLALAHLRYQKDDLKGARELLEKAFVLDRAQWEAPWLLSQIDYRERNYDKARKEAADAVDLGKGKANGAEFIEGLALAQLGRPEEALKKLQAFLKDAPADANAPRAQELVARLEAETKSGATPTKEPNVSGSPSTVVAVSAPALALNWEPAGVDEQKLPVAEGVSCPADEVIEEAGKRVTELVDSVNRIQAKEKISHEELSTSGRPITAEKRTFDYLISIEDSDSGLPTIDEDRQGDFGPSHFLGHLSMFGLADLPLVFHPRLRDDFQMTCEGLGKWRQHATWLVYFRQRPDRPERIRSYELLDGATYTVGLKGRAWIAADTYQIVRLEANLMKPIPQIGLGSEEDVIEYGPVPFQTKNAVLWLPNSADIYFYYQHMPFHRHHEFTDYQLFSVSASQKIGQPPAPPDKDP